MPAAARTAAVPPRGKRKHSNDDHDDGAALQLQPAAAAKKKRSPLLGEPQNFYAPPSIGSMTSQELSAWRKEQRRARNRQSAAASRDKTRARIEELEGEVAGWRSRYCELADKMRRMERHLEALTKMTNAPSGRPAAWVPSPPPPPPAVENHPNSNSANSNDPPRFPQPKTMTHAVAVPNAITSRAPPPSYSSSVIGPNANANVVDPFPPLFSEPREYALVGTPGSAAAVTAESFLERRPHLITISRQAVKTTTGAAGCSEDVHSVQQQQRPASPVPSPSATKIEGDQKGSAGRGLGAVVSRPDEEARDQGEKIAQALSVAGRARGDGGDDDGDEFLDVLVDALDENFDLDL